MDAALPTTGILSRSSRGPIVVEIPKLLDRQPPIAIETEQALLGSLILDPSYITDVLNIVRDAAAFYKPEHQVIYQRLVALADKSGKVDITLLGQALRDEQALEVVGGLDYLMTLANAAGVPALAAQYAMVVADKFRLRKLIAAAGEVLHDVYNHSQAQGDEAKQLIDRAEQRVFEIAQTEQVGDAESLSALVMREYQRISDAEGKGLNNGVMTGYVQLDEMLGGMQPGELIILAARPSMGKTSLAMNIAEQVALGTDQPYKIHPAQGRQRAAVGFFSLEMSKSSVCQRLLSAWAKIDSQKIRSGALAKAEYNTLLDAAKDLAQAPIHIDDTPGLTVTALRARARRLVQKHGVKLLVIDYLQLLSSPAQARESRQVEVGAISRGVKALARELEIPIIALSQLNRGAENREGNRPRMSDLRESGSLEQDADVVLLLHREEYYHKGEPAWDPRSPEFDETNRDKLNLAELIIAKQRNGPTGTVKMTFVPGETRFKNRADADWDIQPGGDNRGGGSGGGGGGYAPQNPPPANRPRLAVDVEEAGSSGFAPPRRAAGFSATVKPSGPISNHRDGGGPDSDFAPPSPRSAPPPLGPPLAPPSAPPPSSPDEGAGEEDAPF